MTRLTTKFVENIKPTDQRREIPDSGCRNLYLVVQPSGRKSWAIRYRYQRKPKKLTFDGPLTLAEARVAATAALHELEQGRDPAALKFDTKAKAEKEAAERQADTVDHWAKHFLDRYVRKHTRPASQRQVEHVLDDIVLPVWRGRLVHDIQRRDIRELVEAVAEDRPVMANRAHAHIRRFFSWLCEQDVIASSPCVGVKPPAKETARDRILSDDEIRALWVACDTVGGFAGPAIKLLLLTGQRCGEVVGMRRSEITGDMWSLPPSRTKNKRAHSVPLSTQAMAIIEAMPIIGDDFVFTSSGARSLGNMSHTKAAIDEIVKPKERWTLHDLRRTTASNLARLGIRLPVIEKCLNHASGSFRGIVGVYQKYDFAAEKRHALQTWASYVDDLVHGKPAGKVVKLRPGSVT
jgi:integrase